MADKKKLHPLHKLARKVRLRYSCDELPGIRRQVAGKGWRYLDAEGRPVRLRTALSRIEALRIPPAWTEVWICPDAQGHLQATGRDAKGRKQYIYHAVWQELSNHTKFQKLREFGEALPALRRDVARHLSQPGLSRQKVVATVVDLLDRTLIRVGNEEYVRSNNSYGLTTLRDRHVRIRGSQVLFRFQGKSGKQHEVGVADRKLARIVRQCQEVPGQELFQYRDARGTFRRVESADVNRYLQLVTGRPFTAKDFRTWKATALVWDQLRTQTEPPASPTQAKRLVTRAITQAASTLGNTVTICRKYYVHPEIAEMFVNGELAAFCKALRYRRQRHLEPSEQLLLAVLKRLARRSSTAC